MSIELESKINQTFEKNCEEKQEYKIFSHEADRKRVVAAGEITSEFLHGNEIKNIIFVDRAARPGYIAVSESWRAKYPNEPLPNMYFMNPEGFTGHFTKANNSEGYKFHPNEEVNTELKNRYNRLIKKGEKVLVFDVCMHRGETIRELVEYLNSASMDVKLAIMNHYQVNASTHQLQHPDLVVLPDVNPFNKYYSMRIFDKDSPTHDCYPFGKDKMVFKKPDSVTSIKNTNKEELETAKQIRKEMYQIMREYYSKSEDKEKHEPKTINTII